MLFRARSNRRARGLEPPPGVNLSITWAEKGSYRAENIVAFLRMRLEEFTPARQEAQAWRILLLDVARSHMHEDAAALAFERGYILLFHFGCTTAIMQVNDTDCHAPLSRVCLHLEEARFAAQQMVDPGNISRTLRDVVADAASAWRQVNHHQASEGHKRVGLSNALDGSEDALICREARLFWVWAGMAAARERAIAEVDRRIASGELRSFQDFRALILNPGDPGIMEDEGGELEGELEDGEEVWEEDDERAQLDREDAAAFEGPPPASAEPEPVSERRAEAEEASVAVERFEKLKRLRSLAMEAQVPSAAFSVGRELNQLERGLAAGSDPKRRQANAILRREMDRRLAEEARAIKEAQMASAEEKRLAIPDRAERVATEMARAGGETCVGEEARRSAHGFGRCESGRGHRGSCEDERGHSGEDQTTIPAFTLVLGGALG